MPDIETPQSTATTQSAQDYQERPETPVRIRRHVPVTDIRFVLAALFSLYGLFVTTLGILATSAQIRQAEGININLWTGLGMLAFGGGCLAWCLTRPQ
jgi:hypothetical protein